MPERWEYGSLMTIALAPSEAQSPEHMVGILITALQARLVAVVELGALIPGERYAVLNAVGQEGWIITGPAVRNDFNRGAAITLDSIRLDPWIGEVLSGSPVGKWARGYFEYPLRRPAAAG
ncbi:MAG TPA: hypothetical protein VGH77_14375 [Streptosporangiaceae bacterium]|jgi:hypothetical protein